MLNNDVIQIQKEWIVHLNRGSRLSVSTEY